MDGKEIREAGAGDSTAVSRSIFALFQRKSIIISETFRKFAAKTQQCATLKPADTECLRVISGEGPFFTMEEHALHGGFGSFVTDVCRAEKLPLPAECIGIGDAFISHGNHECLLKEAGLLPAQTADRIFSVLRRLAE